MGFNDQQNKRISNWIIDELRLNPVSDAIPKQVVPSIQPVFEVNRNVANFQATITKATTGTGSIATTSSTVDTYITQVTYSITKDATCDQATGTLAVNGVIGGTTTPLIRLSVLTLTAQDKTASASFDPPVKLDRNSLISANLSFTAGALVETASIHGYTQETGDVTP